MIIFVCWIEGLVIGGRAVRLSSHGPGTQRKLSSLFITLHSNKHATAITLMKIGIGGEKSERERAGEGKK